MASNSSKTTTSTEEASDSICWACGGTGTVEEGDDENGYSTSECSCCGGTGRS